MANLRRIELLTTASTVRGSTTELQVRGDDGVSRRDRTFGLRVFRAALYRLSYRYTRIGRGRRI
jgi:hypothetical protein